MKRSPGSADLDQYSEYVDHPRYGRTPRITWLNPQSDDSNVFLHWHSAAKYRIKNTAIVADPRLQNEPTVAVTHYYDLDRKCCDCNRKFIFFAEEQRYWYEVLSFALNADCVRCIDCRITQRETSYLRECYESMINQANRSPKETLELAECALTLIQRGVYGHRTLERVRCLLNTIPSESKLRRQASFRDLSSRADALQN
jgi:hypothetical protein